MVIVKLGGRVQSSPELIPALAAWWQAAPGSFAVVHGGGDEVSALQRQLGREPVFVNGRRITSEEDVDLVRMVLSGTSNKRLVAQLVAAGLFKLTSNDLSISGGNIFLGMNSLKILVYSSFHCFPCACILFPYFSCASK